MYRVLWLRPLLVAYPQRFTKFVGLGWSQYFSNTTHLLMTKTISEQSGGDQQITLLEEASLTSMLDWYDQQIKLAEKSKELAVLKSDIAKARMEESYAIVKIAEFTAPPESAEQSKSSGHKPTGNGKNNPLRKT